jgi:hypothetical protein
MVPVPAVRWNLYFSIGSLIIGPIRHFTYKSADVEILQTPTRFEYIVGQ